MLFVIPLANCMIIESLVDAVLSQANAFALNLIVEEHFFKIRCSLHKLYEFKSRTA